MGGWVTKPKKTGEGVVKKGFPKREQEDKFRGFNSVIWAKKVRGAPGLKVTGLQNRGGGTTPSQAFVTPP